MAGQTISGSIGKRGPNTDGQAMELACDPFGGLVNSPTYFEWLRRGYIFVARSAAAAAIPINSTLTNAPVLWNPTGSGKLVVPIKAVACPTAEGTVIIHGATLSYLDSTGATIATNLPFATFTNVAPVSCLRGGSYAATTKFAHGTVTYTANPTAFMDLGFGLWTDGTPASNSFFAGLGYDFGGLLALSEGTAVAIGATAASSTTYTVSIVFAEIPLPSIS